MTRRPRTRRELDTQDGLRRELIAIETEGWGSPRAERLLIYVRDHIVTPQVVEAGFHGPAADQAEATGWAVAWETLVRPSLRETETPWGLLWVAVRKAIHGERMATSYLSSSRTGWRVESARRSQPESPPHFATHLSLSLLVDRGWEPVAEPWSCIGIGPRLDKVVDALVFVGWQREAARAVVEGVAVAAVRDGKKSGEAQGWRPLAALLCLPPWQVRRVTVLLLGAPGWPGLMERMAIEGCHILEQGNIVAALRSTVIAWWPPPPAAARRASCSPSQAPVLVAS